MDDDAEVVEGYSTRVGRVIVVEMIVVVECGNVKDVDGYLMLLDSAPILPLRLV